MTESDPPVGGLKSKPEGRICHAVGEKCGLTSRGIAFGKDKVWLGTNKGLFAWDRKDMFWTRFAIGGNMIDAPVKELALGEGHKLTVAVEEAGKAQKKFEYDVDAQKWSEMK